MRPDNRETKESVLLLQRLFGRREADPRDALRPLYAAIVARARQAHWYLDGGVADSMEGRFEMIATIYSLVVLRLEQEADQARATALLTEILIDDMDAQLREVGVGDMVVGKHIGRLMGALGGRIGAWRSAFADGGDAAIDSVLERNLYAGAAPVPAALAHSRERLRMFAKALAGIDGAAIVVGDLP